MDNEKSRKITTENITKEWIDENGVRHRQRVVTHIAASEPAILLDWLQVKSTWKDKAKANRGDNLTKTVKGCFLGVLHAWYKPSELSGSFELLENIRTTPRTKELVEEFVRRAMNELTKLGVDGLAAAVARKDQVLSLMLQLIKAGQSAGLPDIHPWHVPRIRSAIKDRLAHRLYDICQAAGIKAPSYVGRIDATLPVGACVLSRKDGTWMPAGTKVVGWRLPLVLPQGLLELVTVDPPDHLLLTRPDGMKYLPPHMVVLPPEHALEAQADDDGDIFGFSADNSLIELFSYKLDTMRFAIEPKGKPRVDAQGQPIRTFSPEGLKFLMHDNRGPVGRCTVWRARLLAVGDYDGARALSIAIQECIDQAKRVPEWSDIREAANLGNWKLLEGVWKFDIKFPPEDVPNDRFPLELVKQWVDGRLIERGCFTVTVDDHGNEVPKAINPLWWRYSGKLVDVENWHVPELREEFENLPHHATRIAHALWGGFAEEFKLPTVAPIDVGSLLLVLFSRQGAAVQLQELTIEQYRKLKIRSGLSTYCSRLETILGTARANQRDNREEHENNRTIAIFTEQRRLEENLRTKWTSGELTLDDLVTLWLYECNSQDGGNINNAFRVICWDGSPVLEMLGIAQPTKCQFLHRGKSNRLAYMIKRAVESADPFQGLQELILQSKRHHEGYVDAAGKTLEEPVRTPEGVPVHFHQCPDCMQVLQDAMVQTLRNSKTSRERQFVADLYERLKRQLST